MQCWNQGWLGNTVEGYLVPRIKIYGTWQVLYVEITEAETQMVGEQHSAQDLAKNSSVKQDANQWQRITALTFTPVSYKYSQQQQKIQMTNC